MNGRPRPLTSHQVVIETIAATTTKTGLTVRAMLDTSTCQKGIKITDKDMRTWEARPLHRHDFHGDWNYSITAEPAAETGQPGHARDTGT